MPLAPAILRSTEELRRRASSLRLGRIWRRIIRSVAGRLCLLALFVLSFGGVIYVTLDRYFAIREYNPWVNREYFWHNRYYQSMIRRNAQDVPVDNSTTFDPVPIGEWHGPSITRGLKDALKWNYLMEEKPLGYFGDSRYMSSLPDTDVKYLNALATAKDVGPDKAHGAIGLRGDGSSVYAPRPFPPTYESMNDTDQKAALRTGGFYQAMSDALAVDRTVADLRPGICRSEKFVDINKYPDASVVITFFNEPISTLMRTVYSVLNYTPSLLLHEIILVDDHSNLQPIAELEEFVRYLPKVKLMRLPERRGIVQARMAGARAAKGAVMIVLDSHIEVNPGWSEPLLKRIHEDPTVLIFPQILGMSPTDFTHRVSSGIGCFLTWRWSVVEQASLTGTFTNTSPMASPSMAGGLFAIDLDWFWELGGYDPGFIAWGAENVEMAFRIWMCGGRVECAPCSQTFHIYRKGGSGYSNPPGALWTNRIRTARVWMDEYFQIAERVINMGAAKPYPPADNMGNLDSMLRLKRDLKCKSFKWYLENVDPNHDLQNITDLLVLGKLSDGAGMCVDLLGKRGLDDAISVHHCHQGTAGGNQAMFIAQNDDRVRLMVNDKRCIGVTKDYDIKIMGCTDSRSNKWKWTTLSRDGENLKATLVWDHQYCLDFTKKGEPGKVIKCKEGETVVGEAFDVDSNFKLPKVEKNLRHEDKMSKI